ncbi:unnamed protein product [Camellia sinensis]
MSLFKEMSRKRLLPDTVTYTTLIGGLCQARKLRDALFLFNEMQVHGQIPNLFTYSVLLDGLCKNQHLDEALALFKKLEKAGLAPDIVIYSNLIQGMCKAGKLDDARKLYLSLSAKGLKPDVHTYNIMINGLCKGRLLDEASELLMKMEEEGCSPNFYSYNILVQGFLQNNGIQKALQLLHIMDDRAISVDPCTVTLLGNMLSDDGLDHLSKEMLSAFFGTTSLSKLMEKNSSPHMTRQSGTGNTATFCSGILQQLDYSLVECQALVLPPTLELAQQSVKVHACVGGTSVREDQRILSSGVHVVVGTPGRVFDMLRRQSLRPVYIKMFVLDEADEMLSRGFKNQIYDIFQLLPPKIQVGVFSVAATQNPGWGVLCHNATRDS